MDFIAMTSILAIGRKTDTNAHYVHTGDLSWWVFYSDHNVSHWQEHITLWECDGNTIGWTLLDPDCCSFDVFILPELSGSTSESHILDWSIDHLIRIVCQQGGKEIRTIWVSEHDTQRIQQLEKRGFQPGEESIWYLDRSLEEHVSRPQLPSGYSLRKVTGGQDIKTRAEVAYRAFGSPKAFDEYWPRYQRFFNSPVYLSSIDLVTVSPKGDFSSFCIVWPDPVNQNGVFEPVGTHPEFRSRGLGKAVVTEGLRRLQSCGMTRASVCTEFNNLAAQRLFQAVGFQKQYQLNTYIKKLD
jgi:ribosomal protein S18 acetylase RimI-like enzyme